MRPLVEFKPSYDFLYEWHIVNKKSISELSKSLGISETRVRNKFAFFNIKEIKRCKYCGSEKNLRSGTVRKKYVIFNLCESCFKKHPNKKKSLELSFDILYDLHVVNKKSILEISNLFDTSSNVIKRCFSDVSLVEIKRCKMCNTEKNLVLCKGKELNICKDCKHDIGFNSYNDLSDEDKKKRLCKTENTFLEKYGVTNIFKDKNYIESKVFEKYGVTNIFKDVNFKEHVKKIKQERYGDPYYRNPEKAIQTCLKNFNKEFGFINSGKSYSKISQKLCWDVYNNISPNLQKHTYFAELNKEFCSWDSIKNKSYYYDFVITSIKVCIEFNGDAFHYHPKTWRGSPFGISVESIEERDIDKKNCLLSKGYYPLVVWEHEYNNSGAFITQSLIRLIENLENKICQ